MTAILLSCGTTVLGCGTDDPFLPIQCVTSDESSAVRNVAAGSLVRSDIFEGCILGETIVCPDDAEAYANVRCGEVQTGSVRR